MEWVKPCGREYNGIIKLQGEEEEKDQEEEDFWGLFGV
jgi:hypothetical protein